ncbi:Hopanoid biosynthesis associated glycosyl transferase protein HpnI [Hyphomicrobium sp. GJ21]|uniref:bacteriohopanetetrol glucosamine biosynthesis glycosyltransferase HpnI n=1 Tax=Hyphomicrobium sp. GJ21 TaxID=113574 RepID=UPI000622B759|nr:bacteriohopanetetrol glucosamine biosynthesis glycosyltransferase HpnI [Hyphomicrobium sp. GJ21]CEJ86683.1 Hopanoid biosynthesis associated glycosyl transferase protein HpnI [Hyphomicrobium sp. GJ21]
MPFIVFSIWQFAGVALGVAGLAYLILAVRAVSRFRERAVFGAEPRPGVSVLKPVYGTNPQLYESLRSFCLQDYPKFEVIFGAHTADDPAIEVVNRLIAENPGLDLRLVVDETLAGPNRKAANLANIARTAKYDLFVLADSDVRVDPDCIAAMAAPFDDKTVGAVASIYKGWPADNTPSRFGALYLNDWFVPSVTVDVDLRGIDFVFGAMSAVRREALDAIGGFDMLAGCLAEDFSMGRFVARRGWRVVLSPYACDTVVAEPNFASMFQHEVRWHRSERACRPFDQFMAVVTWPLALLLILLLPQPSIIGLSIIGAHVTLRIILHYLVRRNLRIATPPEPWLVPLRECVCFFAWVAGMFGNNIKWGKETFSIRAYRKLMAAETAAHAPAVTGPSISKASHDV